MDRKTVGKEPNDCRIEDIEPAGEGAEGRQDEAPSVADETAPGQSSHAQPHRCHGMEMPADLAVRRSWCRLMPEDNLAHRQLAEDTAAEIENRRRIVVSGDPYPLMRRNEIWQKGGIGFAQPLAGRAVMEAVAEADDRLRAMAPQHTGQALETGACRKAAAGRPAGPMAGRDKPSAVAKA